MIHYSKSLADLVQSMTVDDLIKEAERNPFAVEITRRVEEAARSVDNAIYWKNRLAEEITEARKRYA